MIKKIRYTFLLLSVVLMAGSLIGCDKLSDDDYAVAELLPGTWAFSYELQSEEETGLSFSYDHVIFRKEHLQQRSVFYFQKIVLIYVRRFQKRIADLLKLRKSTCTPNMICATRRSAFLLFSGSMRKIKWRTIKYPIK